MSAFLAALVAAAAPSFSFGMVGGNIRPISAAIAPSGRVTVDGRAGGTLAKAQLAKLLAVERAERFFALPATISCAGALPDVASRYIRVVDGRRTWRVTVHGGCNARFNRVYAALARAAKIHGMTTWYHVRDLDAARRFYAKLGFEERHVNQDERWAELGRGDVTIALAEGEPGDGGVAAIDVDDVKAEAERLRREGADVGVVFELHDQIRLLDVFDPDGNRIQLTQELGS